ncbi:hypothetical protein Salat_2147200 [Sesamum alatum]|uniref:GAG-pre-integrase domain-containing protein n=1 Tax=Sesamum alatum TaxID=300844 RepID=A0AAE1Y1I7_9LAMI|nr:hypothetical protein Salat_2147200 [Sesamum alatum]
MKIFYKKRNVVIAIVAMRNKTFPLMIPLVSDRALKFDDADLSTLWHLRYGHLNNKALIFLKEKNMVNGLSSIKKSTSVCEGCIYGKMHKLRFPKTSWRATAPLELVYSEFLKNRTPYEAWYKKKSVVDHFKIFGILAYALIPSQRREKFDDKGQKLTFVGYIDESKGYRLFDLLQEKSLFHGT